MTLTEFLLARITEDEAVARKALRGYQHVFGISHYFTANSDTSVAMTPLVALAECEAKRRIVESSLNTDLEAYNADERTGGVADGLGYAVAHLAAVYADHPDYRDEWKP